MNPRCVCPGPGKCEKYAREHVGRLYELCAAINCSLEVSNSYHDSWEASPNLFNRFGKFLKSTAEFIAAGTPRVTDEEYRARLLVCDQCEQCDRSTDAWQCKLCGCNLKEGTLMPGKARWATEKCPINKWASLELNIISKPGPCCGSRVTRD